MKKGNTWPRVRASWVQGANIFRPWAPPVWATVYQCFGVFITFVDDLPVPITVNESDCDLGLWRYNPDNGMVVWRGAWSNIGGSGFWYFGQRNNESEWTQRFFTLELVTDIGSAYNKARNNPTGDHGDWDGTQPSPVIAENGLSFDLPWVTPCFCRMQGTRYATIRAAGIDSDNTEPATWTYPGMP